MKQLILTIYFHNNIFEYRNKNFFYIFLYYRLKFLKNLKKNE